MLTLPNIKNVGEFKYIILHYPTNPSYGSVSGLFLKFRLATIALVPDYPEAQTNNRAI